MPNPYTFVPLTEEYLAPAVALWTENYRAEQEHSPLLPARVLDEPAWIQGVLQSNIGNPGVAVVEQNRLLAYMVTGDRFHWKGQQAAIVFEYGHSAVLTKRRTLYQQMYLHLAQKWIDQHIHLHLIRHFAHDAILQETLFQLGFGAILAERLRDLAEVEGLHDVVIRVEQDINRLTDLQIEHNLYYPQSPIFIQKPTEKEEVAAELEEHAAQGDLFLVYEEAHEPCAYMIVGQSAIDAEGFLLEQTRTAQIKSAYTRPRIRGNGIGTALLQRAIQWAQQQGYERLFVEHETANVYGGNFWRKYFSPYLYSSMRYIDNSL